MMTFRPARPAARLALLLFAGLACLSVALVPLPRPQAVSAQSTPAPIVLGGLLSQNAGEATLGKNSQAALNLAVLDINADLQSAGSSTRFAVSIVDTQLDPATALQQAQALAAQGVQVAIGPQTSSEAAAILPWANANSFLILSHGSTASSLSLPDDNLLRFVPDDSYEMQAIAALLQHDGIKAVVPLWRDDAGNGGLHTSLVRAFPAAGGVVLSGASYPPDTSDYAQELATVSSQVQQAEQQYGAKSVAVVLASFDEAAPIFDAAQSDPVLASVAWYGTDGVAQSTAITHDAQAAAFAEQVGFPCANLGLDPQASTIWKPLSTRISAITGSAPDASALAAYDAAWVTALAYVETGSAPTTATLRQAIVNVANRYYGATGRTALNAAGDRDGGDYDFWAVRDQAGSPQWTLVNSYEAVAGGAGQIVPPAS